MPELPEVEIARLGLASCVTDREIESVLVHRRQSIRTPREDSESFALMLRGHRVLRLQRQGKALLFSCSRGLVMVFHFKLGAFVRCHDYALAETNGVCMNFAGNGSLEFSDMGLSEFHLVPVDELSSVQVIKPGLDPLSRALSPQRLARVLPANRQLKAAMTDQDILAGIGNTYSDEICWRARMMPTRKVSSLSNQDFAVLTHEIKATLREAIRKGGERGFRGPDGREGRYEPAVHGKDGRPCPRDGALITAISAGRKTYYCPACQE
ncbi:MAG: Fpg/Nei family DNA glycosylase [Gaiellales bacterium]|nr:MAG: Fpg/Nei family DNA glycosylase [Gaiellales bacterium]